MDASSTRPTELQRLAEMLSHFRTLDPLASPAVEMDFLAPLMAEGDFLNVSGEAGCGKTMLAADLLLAYAHRKRRGAALGGLLQFNPVFYCSGNVGIIDAENAPPRWQSLLLRKMKAEGLDPSELRGQIEYVRPVDLGLHKSREWPETSPVVAQALAERGITFAIIDSLGRTWSPDDLNSTGWVQQGFAPFRVACQELGITVVALTHTRRSRGRDDPDAVGPLGSSMQEAQADAQVMMTINADGRGCRLTLRKSRRAFWIQPNSTVALEFTQRLGYRPADGWELLWPHTYNQDLDLPQDPPSTGQQIIDLLAKADGGVLKSTAIAKALQFTRHTATNHLTNLERAGAVLRRGNGPATQWSLR